MTPQLEAAINGLAEDFKPEVTKIEARLATTQNHYGDYMHLINVVSKDKRTAQIVSLALIKAGASRDGVSSAMKVLHG